MFFGVMNTCLCVNNTFQCNMSVLLTRFSVINTCFGVVNTCCLQVVGQTRPVSQSGPGCCDETGIYWWWELSPGRRQPGSSTCKACLSFITLFMFKL